MARGTARAAHTDSRSTSLRVGSTGPTCMNTIRGAPLAGGGSVDTLYGPAEGVNAPYAVIDPADAISIVRAPPSSALARWVTSAIGAIVGVLQSLGRPNRTTIGRIYWTQQRRQHDPRRRARDPRSRRRPLRRPGSGSQLAVLPRRAPCSGRNCGTRDIGRSRGWSAQPLSCSRGAWAGDLAGASLFRAPQSFAYQWIRGGSDIGGATLRTFTPTTPGSYACRVTAINRAGGTSQTSAVLVV